MSNVNEILPRAVVTCQALFPLAEELFLCEDARMNELMTTSEAAEALGVSVRRVRQLIDEEKLSARRVGRDYVIEAAALESVRVYGKPGRPPKTTPGANKRATGQIRGSNGTSTGGRGKKKGGKK
jgi:excisionase family DNA binding protein